MNTTSELQCRNISKHCRDPGKENNGGPAELGLKGGGNGVYYPPPTTRIYECVREFLFLERND